MSTDYRDPNYDRDDESPHIVTFVADGFPPPRLPGESDVFARHRGLPGHNQEALSAARVVIVGAGGLGSWVALALARSGVRHLTIIDPDRFDRTNASRQLMFAADVGECKAMALARNVVPHMIAGGAIVGLAMPFETAAHECVLAADILAVGVDNNRCRWEAARFGLKRRIPVVFSMISADALRVQVFLQESDPAAACLWCALPNLDPDESMSCTPSAIHACLVASAQVTFLLTRAVMRTPVTVPPINWRSSDLSGMSDDQALAVRKRRSCICCRASLEEKPASHVYS